MVKELFLLLFFIILSNTSYSAVVATVDRTDIAMNESFTLRYESDDDIKRTPDFSPINKDFDIIGQNKSTSLNIINGKSSKKTIYDLNLIAKRAGTLTIPEIRIGNSTSASIIINVKNKVDHSNDKDINFTVSVDKKQSFIQEQIIITVKLARAIRAQQEGISDLSFSHEDIIIEPLSDDYKQYEAMLNGRRHIIYERQYAVFPQKAGELRLEPITYSATIPTQQRRQRSFFDDPFRTNGKRIRELSEGITFNIKPKPDDFIGKHWLPANKVEISTKFSSNLDQLQVGDSVTRTITINADQQLASSLPTVATQNINNAKVYPDQADTTQQKAKYGIYSQRIERTAIVPTKAGEIIFPTTQIEWWNTRTNKKEVINIPSETIRVAASNHSTSDIDNHTNISTSSSKNGTTQTSSKWFYIAIFALLGWLCTIVCWLYLAFFKNRFNRSNTSGSKNAILTACKNNNASAAKEALIAWAKYEWPDKHIQSLGTISNIANNNELTEALNNLQNNLYGQTATKWNKQKLIKCIKNFERSKSSTQKSNHLLFNIN